MIGTAHYSSTSQITLRLLSDRAETIDRAFFLRRLGRAMEHRERVVTGSNAFRAVYSEGDLLPGLIVDRYGQFCVMQTLNQGMDRAKDLIAGCLAELMAPAGILARNDASVRKLEGLALESVVMAGEIPERVAVEMNGLKMEADLIRGQKTGIYLDQRENYVAQRGEVGAGTGTGLLSLRRADSRCTRRRGWNWWKRWIRRRRRWLRRNRMREQMGS